MRVQLSSGSFQNFTDQISSMVDEIVGRQYVRFSATDAWKPDVNVYETPSALLVCVDLAGMKAEEIDVQAEGNKLIVSGRRNPLILADVAAHDVRVHLMEIDGGPFRREIEIHIPIQREQIAANYRDGLLWLTIPKAG